LYHELLQLNPHDNQGIRYFLACCLLERGRDKEFAEFMNEHGDELSCFMAFVFIVFVLCSTFAFLLYVPNGDLSLLLGMRGSSTDTQESLSSIDNQFYLMSLPASEAFGRTIHILAARRQSQNWQRFSYRSFDIQTVSFICTTLPIFSFFSIFIKTNKHISIIALPMGGHAPPTI